MKDQSEANSGVIILQCESHYMVSEVKGEKPHIRQITRETRETPLDSLRKE